MDLERLNKDIEAISPVAAVCIRDAALQGDVIIK